MNAASDEPQDFFQWYLSCPAFTNGRGGVLPRRRATTRARELKIAIIKVGQARIVVPSQANAAIAAAAEALADEMNGKRRGRGRPRAGST